MDLEEKCKLLEKEKLELQATINVLESRHRRINKIFTEINISEWQNVEFPMIKQFAEAMEAISIFNRVDWKNQYGPLKD